MSLARFLAQMQRGANGDPLPTVRWFGLRLTLAAVFIGLACCAVGFWLVVIGSWVWGWLH